MPPKRCPECGRFLANDLVSSLAEAPAPCPRCGIELHPDTIVGGDRDRRARPARAAEPAEPGVTDRPASPVEPASAPVAAAREALATESSSGPDPEAPAADSIRPPDLDPDAVRTVDDDVLAGWDLGATSEEIASWRADERPFPTDAAVVVGFALLGGLLGALLAGRQRGRAAAVGALGGAVGAGAMRRIWELRG